MPRFAVLQHDHPKGRHWDFMLESEDSLMTWSLPRPLETGVRIQIERLPDHRIAYLDYEGPVSNNRGDVVRVEEGTFEWMRLENDAIRIRLNGKHFQGSVLLVKQRSLDEKASDESIWILDASTAPSD